MRDISSDVSKHRVPHRPQSGEISRVGNGRGLIRLEVCVSVLGSKDTETGCRHTRYHARDDEDLPRACFIVLLSIR